MNHAAILQTNQVVQKFGGLVAVNQVSIDIGHNQIVGLIGPNGAGKTTLFNNITGVNPPTAGKIYFKDVDITGQKPFEIVNRGIARTFQNIRLFKNMTVQENVIAGMHTRVQTSLFDAVFHTKRYARETKECLEKANVLLDFVGLYDQRFELATCLPYGYQRKLEIARAMASDPALLLLDEPAAGMNDQETEELQQFVRTLQERGFTILLIEHDMKLVMNVCEKIYVLDHGERIAEGTAAEIKQDPRVIEAYLGKEDQA